MSAEHSLSIPIPVDQPSKHHVKNQNKAMEDIISTAVGNTLFAHDLTNGTGVDEERQTDTNYLPHSHMQGSDGKVQVSSDPRKVESQVGNSDILVGEPQK